MSVISATTQTGPYVGNGVTTTFPFDFTVTAATELYVQADGVTVSTSAYTVTINANGSGSVVMGAAPANGVSIMIYQSPDWLQDSQFETQGAYSLASVNAINRRQTIRANYLAKIPANTNASSLTSGTLAAGRMPALTGDVTTTVGTVATTIGANKVTRGMLSATAGAAILGATGAGNVSDLTAAQATSILNAVVGDAGSGGTKGLVPAPGAGDNAAGKFLKADGTWSVPPGTGGGAGTTTNALTINNSGSGVASGGTFNGASAITISYNSIGATRAGAITAGDLTISTARLAGRTTAATGAIEEISVGANLSLSAGVLNTGATVALLASPTFTGTPAAPTAAVGTNTTQIATTAFVQGEKASSLQTVASASTVTPTFLNDQVNVTALAAPCQFLNPTGTPTEKGIAIRIKDNGTARALTYDTQYRAVGVTLPTTTVISKTLYLGMIYNSADTKWDVVSVAQEA